MSAYNIPKAEVLRYLGHRGQELTPELDRRIDVLMERALAVATPRECTAEYPVEATEAGVRLVGTELVLTGKDIARHLEGARACALLGVTLGAAVEREILLLERRSMTDVVIFDAACTALIECVADRCESEIVGGARARGLYTNFRFSPGYGDLPIELQREFLAVLGASRRIGLTVTETSLLLPRKSVTAVVGLFDRPQKSSKRGCESCNLRESCALRRRGTPCGGGRD